MMFKKNVSIPDPPISDCLFSNSRSACIWLILRVWLGYGWVNAALHKITSPAWVNGGPAIKGYWERAIQIPEAGKPPIAYDWYRQFLQFLLENDAHTWFGPLIAYGELLVGIGLIVGAFVGIAAFFGAVMNWSFIMAGSASTNAMLLVAAVILMPAWKVAGYYGADYFLLRYVGVPWRKTEP